jgi:alditol oxidase
VRRPTNWARNVEFGAQRLHQPASLDDLRRIVEAAHRVRALGTGHSFNRIADSDEDMVSVAGLPPHAVIDADRATVTVTAGMRYAEVAEALRGSGFALANLASLPHISVAGAIATGTHGSGDTLGALATAVAGLRMVGPQGDVVELSRHADPENFPGAAVSLGALGVVVDVTLDLVPSYTVSQYVYEGLSLSTVAGSFDDVFGSAYSVSVFTDWNTDDAAAWLKVKQQEGPQEPNDGPIPGPAWLGARPAPAARHPVPGMSASHCSQQLGVPGPWHERLPHFRPEFTPSNGEELQSEFLLPRSAAPAAIGALRTLGPVLRPALQISEIRTVAADALWLSPAYGRDTVAFHFTWIDDAQAVAPALAAVEERLIALAGRPHWGKLFGTPLDQVAAGYVRAVEFRQLMLSHDPEGKFRNAFVDGAFPGTRP